ncbi:unnamed protein product [Pleuronectes platessa]|uniref:Uncharacterized protein n=1 Tax=Pleuronectes platessa TaxID=8262 RepID=A0A9N7YG71_PLEPL|nr:unnamed protein product [Pleuronectes platessa]
MVRKLLHIRGHISSCQVRCLQNVKRVDSRCQVDAGLFWKQQQKFVSAAGDQTSSEALSDEEEPSVFNGSRDSGVHHGDENNRPPLLSMWSVWLSWQDNIVM